MTIDQPRRWHRLESEHGRAPGPGEAVPDKAVPDRDDQAPSVSDSSSAAAMVVSIAPVAHGRTFFLSRLAALRASSQQRTKDVDPDAA